MPGAQIAFYIFGLIAIVFSLLTVTKKNPVTSAFCLIVVFFSFAGIYATLDAHLIAALQVLVYAGAIMVLFAFVIMLLGADVPSLDFQKSSFAFKVIAGTLTIVATAIFVFSFKESSSLTSPGRYTAEFLQEHGGNTKVLSVLMFTEYLLPFELTSVLLLAGIVGAVAVAKRKGKA